VSCPLLALQGNLLRDASSNRNDIAVQSVFSATKTNQEITTNNIEPIDIDSIAAELKQFTANVTVNAMHEVPQKCHDQGITLPDDVDLDATMRAAAKDIAAHAGDANSPVTLESMKQVYKADSLRKQKSLTSTDSCNALRGFSK
jgi:hypothetical protein